MAQYHYTVIISVFDAVTTDLKEALYFYEGESDGFRIIDNKQGDWGDIYPMVLFKKEGNPLPNKLKLRWITPEDGRCYELETELDTDKLEKQWTEQKNKYRDAPFKYLVVGLAPYGEIALWLRSNENAVLFQQLKANEGELDENEAMVYSTTKGDDRLMASLLSKEQYCSLMRQYTYRYVPLEEYFDGQDWQRFDVNDERYQNITVQCVEDKRSDGTFDFTDDETLMKFHVAGMPNRVTVKWQENKDSYVAHFWLDPDYVGWFFESFQEKYPETPMRLMLRLDTQANQYEMAMAVDEHAPKAFVGTQYIVLKNFEEVARSDYYDKEDGAWRWM